MTGSLQPWCYAGGMTHYVYEQGIRIFDYAKFAEPLREQIRGNAERLAEANGIKIEFIRKKDFRRGTIRPVLFARPNLVSIPVTVLFQWPCLAGWQIARRRHPVQNAG